MKKKISLQNLEVKSFNTSTKNDMTGGVPTSIQSVEPEFCNWTFNNWCWSNAQTDCYLWCTAPK